MDDATAAEKASKADEVFEGKEGPESEDGKSQDGDIGEVRVETWSTVLPQPNLTNIYALEYFQRTNASDRKWEDTKVHKRGGLIA